MHTALTEFCEAKSVRWRLFPGRIRNRMLEGIVADWPERVNETTRIEEILRQRGRERIKAEYGSVLLLILAPLLTELIKLAIKWWLERRTNQVLMRVWNAEANR